MYEKRVIVFIGGMDWESAKHLRLCICYGETTGMFLGQYSDGVICVLCSGGTLLFCHLHMPICKSREILCEVLTGSMCRTEPFYSLFLREIT